MPDLLQRLQEALKDRYRLERTLGHGGTATVFLARDLKHGRLVAIKVLDPEVGAAIGVERFLREIQTISPLIHPNILPLHDSGQADGLVFFVMPYVEGTLRDRLRREQLLPVEDAVKIAREVADALTYAHTRGVVHRDVKPENILLESGHAVVADFGLALAMRAAGGERLTTGGTTLGTPAYMSPEQASGERDLDGRSDLYSLGCVMYEMLTGQPPFTGPSVAVMHAHINVPPRPVTEIRPLVSANVAAAVQRALAKLPADRFNPIAQFAEALGPAAAPQHRPLAPVLVVSAAVAAVAVAAWLGWGPLVAGLGEISGLHPAPVRGGADNGARIGFADFSSVRGLTLVGTAQCVGPALRLVSNSLFQVGSAYTQPVDVSGFSTDFRFAIGSAEGLGGGADGLAFVIRGPNSSMSGPSGGGFGYEGIRPSVAVEVDVFQNRENNDPNNNHIGIDLDGSVIGAAVLANPCGPSLSLKNGSIYHVWIDFDGRLLSVAIAPDGNPKPATMLSHAVRLPFRVGSVGFTASTGEGWANHDVLSWNFATVRPVGRPLRGT